jgi:membrane protease subunit HflK
MERNIQKNGLVNLLALLAAGVGAFAVARYSNSLAGQIEAVFLALGLLVAAVSWFHMRLEDSERLEKLELDELARSHGGSALFETKEAEVFPAQRAREQFERFFVPVFTALLCLTEGGSAALLWRWLSRSTTSVGLKQPTAGMFLFFLFALVLFLLGRFAATFARLQDQRLLRPGASYLLLNAVLCAAVGSGIVAVEAGFAKADLYVAYTLCVLLAIVALETLAALVLEVYRPRLKGKVQRPLYDSRLVGLLGQPEGLIRTASQAIDYQFGFKVSETWFYQFFERALLWLLPLQLMLLLVSTCLVIVEPGEQALLERFGSPVAGRMLLGPGAHFKWPWPVDKVYRYRTEQIQTFDVGFTPDPEREKEPAVLWAYAHAKEDNFLIANREPSSIEDTNQAPGDVAGKRTPPVSLLTVSIPVQYQITNLEAWAYKNANAPALLQDISTREVVRYLVGADLTDLMTRGRQQASQTLAARMQAASDERNLGARILSVGLEDLHPPVKVARDYENVVGAEQTRYAKILEADADRIKTNALADAQALTVVNEAKAASTGIEIHALAQAALFTNQVPAFAAAPAVYAQRAYLQSFARGTANARKYVVLTTNTHDVIVFDLQDSIAKDFLTLKAPQPAPAPK